MVFFFGLGQCFYWPASQIFRVKAFKSSRSIFFSYFSLENPPIFIILPLQIDNANSYQPIVSRIMCTRNSYLGKNDHFWLYPQIDGRIKYFLGKFSTFFKLDSLLYLIIYPHKLPGLMLYLNHIH